jgi:FHS family L-fucose permease-like MFS transporter
MVVLTSVTHPVCGPPKYSEIRLNFAQAFNGIGTVVAPLIGSYIFFDFDEDKAMANVQWVYLAIACFVFLLAGVFFLTTIPEITDADMEFQAAETHAGAEDVPFRKQYRLFHAAFAQFCYTGAQVAIAGFFINYVTETRPGTSSSLGAQFLAGAQACHVLGRFGGAVLMNFVKPRWVFLAFLTMCIVFSGPAMTQTGNTGMSMLYLVLFFESVCFPTILGLGMRGLGKHTKRGSGWIVAGVFGGACVPPLMGVAGDNHGTGFSMIVPMMFFVGSFTYALAVNFWPWYRDTVDAFLTTDIGIVNRPDEVLENGDGAVSGGDVASMGEDKPGAVNMEKAG